MINLNLEKESILSAQDRYDIIGFAIEAADDNGFINSFVYERALYCYAAIVFYPERKEEIAALLVNNPIAAWDTLLADGTIIKMNNDYSNELTMLATESANWYEEYADWAHSARALLDSIQDFTGNMVQSAAQQLDETAKQSGVTELLNIAEEWGMNRPVIAPEIESKYIEPVSNSLFTD